MSLTFVPYRMYSTCTVLYEKMAITRTERLAGTFSSNYPSMKFSFNERARLSKTQIAKSLLNFFMTVYVWVQGMVLCFFRYHIYIYAVTA